MTVVLIKRGRFDIETDMHAGRTAHEAEGRDQSDAPIGRGMPTITSTPPDVRREAEDRFSLTAPRRNGAWQHLDLRLLASRTVRQKCHPVCGTFHAALAH